MEDSSKTDHCWACMTDLIQTDQKICGNCHRWQKSPWKYLNLSNTALAVVAALVSTGLALATSFSSYQQRKDFNLYVDGKSLQVSKRNLNFYIQNYSRLAILVEPEILCSNKSADRSKMTFRAIERYRSFPPLMPEQLTSYLKAADGVKLVEGEELLCDITLQNENRYKRTYQISVKVTE